MCFPSPCPLPLGERVRGSGSSHFFGSGVAPSPPAPADVDPARAGSRPRPSPSGLDAASVPVLCSFDGSHPVSLLPPPTEHRGPGTARQAAPVEAAARAGLGFSRSAARRAPRPRGRDPGRRRAERPPGSGRERASPCGVAGRGRTRPVSRLLGSSRPLFFYLLAPLTRWLVDSPNVYFAARAVMAVTSGLALVVVYRLARRLSRRSRSPPSPARLPAPVRSPDHRGSPDVPALVAWLGTLLAWFAGGRARRRRGCGSPA